MQKQARAWQSTQSPGDSRKEGEPDTPRSITETEIQLQGEIILIIHKLSFFSELRPISYSIFRKERRNLKYIRYKSEYFNNTWETKYTLVSRALHNGLTTEFKSKDLWVGLYSRVWRREEGMFQTSLGSRIQWEALLITGSGKKERAGRLLHCMCDSLASPGAISWDGEDRWRLKGQWEKEFSLRGPTVWEA